MRKEGWRDEVFVNFSLQPKRVWLLIKYVLSVHRKERKKKKRKKIEKEKSKRYIRKFRCAQQFTQSNHGPQIHVKLLCSIPTHNIALTYIHFPAKYRLADDWRPLKIFFFFVEFSLRVPSSSGQTILKSWRDEFKQNEEKKKRRRKKIGEENQKHFWRLCANY